MRAASSSDENGGGPGTGLGKRIHKKWEKYVATQARLVRFAQGHASPMEMKMRTNTIRPMAAAVVIGFGVLGVIGAMSDASARVSPYRYLRSHQHGGRTYRPPEGQIYQRAFRNAPTREGRVRQDFQLDGTLNGN